jgi:hypothetical protein
VINREQIDRLFEYRNGKLYWKLATCNSVKVGDEVGTIIGNINHLSGYYVTRIKGVRIYIHKIVFLMFHGYTATTIRFLDGNSLNYAIENLRDCSVSEVLFTAKKRKDNSSGYKGVSWSKKRNKWVCWIGKDKKKIWLGYFDDKEKAHQAYIKESIKLYGNLDVRETN